MQQRIKKAALAIPLEIIVPREEDEVQDKPGNADEEEHHVHLRVYIGIGAGHTAQHTERSINYPDEEYPYDTGLPDLGMMRKQVMIESLEHSYFLSLKKRLADCEISLK